MLIRDEREKFERTVQADRLTGIPMAPSHDPAASATIRQQQAHNPATLAEPRVRPASTPFRSRERLDGAGARRARCRGMGQCWLATSGSSA
jgi:hypothetical protein